MQCQCLVVLNADEIQKESLVVFVRISRECLRSVHRCWWRWRSEPGWHCHTNILAYVPRRNKVEVSHGPIDHPLSLVQGRIHCVELRIQCSDFCSQLANFFRTFIPVWLSRVENFKALKWYHNIHWVRRSARVISIWTVAAMRFCLRKSMALF